MQLVFLLLVACAAGPTPTDEPAVGKIVCDSFIILDMCVRDLQGDETVDMIYFTDTSEIFMYREGMKEVVGAIMPFHQCAVTLSPEMQAITNQLLQRDSMTLTQQLGVKRELIGNYMASKPEIDACNESFENKSETKQEPEEFFIDELEWEDL